MGRVNSLDWSDARETGTASDRETDGDNLSLGTAGTKSIHVHTVYI